MKNTTYRFPETLRFKHLKKHELFYFPRSGFKPAMGPYMKISARRYVEATVTWRGNKIVPHIKASPVYHVGTINVPVTDAIHCHITNHTTYVSTEQAD